MPDESLIYLDHAATTPIRAEALEAMLPFFGEHFANPMASHGPGRVARRALDRARDELAAAIGCAPGDVVFTSGGTEADNLAVLGLANGPGTVLCSAVEHEAVLRPCAAAGGTVVPVHPNGTIDLAALAEALHPGVRLVSVMLANNETGVLQPLDAVAALVAERAPDALLHSDAVQAFNWLDVAGATASCDLVSLSAHKFGGPKGVGVLVVRPRAAKLLAPVLHGGPQERGRRPGTHNVAGAVGTAVAASLAVAERSETVPRVGTLRDHLETALVGAVGSASPTSPGSPRLAGTCHLRFPGVEAEALLVLLADAGVAASAGSACQSGAQEPSHVLVAMGMEESAARECVRFSLGRTTGAAEIEAALGVIPRAVDRLAPAR